jgi:signal transduction histidine kinase
MLTYEEQEKIEHLMKQDENACKLIMAIRDDYQLTLSQISHEIRNPLTYVDSSIQWIQKMHPEVYDFEFWDQMKNDLAFLNLLLDDISTLNHGDELNICRIDPKEFAWDLKDTLLSELLQQHIALLVKLDESYPDFYGDPVRLKQAFLNLIKNAMESITDHGRITLKIFTHKKRLLIAVQDSGCGIPPEQQADIFKPFVTHKKGGTGLGLAIVQRIVYAHHGTIQMRSTVGKGTEFQVHLPLAPSILPHEPVK